jgi:hypothetical protein
MNPLEWILKGRFGTAARAGAGFVTVSIVGAIGLVVVAVVLWAASLTPFGLWAGVPVLAAGGAVAYSIWRQGRGMADGSLEQSAALELRAPSSWSGGSLPAGEAPNSSLPRFRLIGSRGAAVPSARRAVVAAPATADDLKRSFDQALAAGQFDQAERVLGELEVMPGQAEWARRKQRLVRQQRART